MPRLFILVTGMPGSGKSIVVEVAREMGLPVYNMGDVVREEVLKRFGEITPELMVKVSQLLREEYGEDVVALRTLDRVSREQGHCIVVVDGVRSLREVEVFKNRGDVVIVAVHASPKTRFERLLRRKRPGDPVNYEEFLKRDYTELGFGVGSVIALADYVIVNEGELSETREVARRVLSEVVMSRGRDCR